MKIRIGLENNIEGRSLAWALDYPGCFSYGNDEAEALIHLPKTLLNYEQWIKNHTTNTWINFMDFDLRVVEKFDTFRMNADYTLALPGEGYEINAWFTDDWRPLSALEIEQGLEIFHWQRNELIAGLSTLEPELLQREFPHQRWNILGIAKHIANAELWYLQRLELTKISRRDLSTDYETRLSQTAALIDQEFPRFVGSVNVSGIEGEFWSYRKILRRTLWHQRDHIDHIKTLVIR